MQELYYLTLRHDFLILFFSAIYYGVVYVFFVPQLIFLFFSKAILTKKPVGNIVLPTDFLYSFPGSVLNNHNDELICSWFQFNFLILMPFRKAFPCRDFNWMLMLPRLFSTMYLRLMATISRSEIRFFPFVIDADIKSYIFG